MIAKMQNIKKWAEELFGKAKDLSLYQKLGVKQDKMVKVRAYSRAIADSSTQVIFHTKKIEWFTAEIDRYLKLLSAMGIQDLPKEETAAPLPPAPEEPPAESRAAFGRRR